MSVRLVALLSCVSACVIHTDDPLWDDHDSELSVYAEPGELLAGERTLMTVYADQPDPDFDDLLDVRPLGEFEILEWTAGEDVLQVVVLVDEAASGEQPFALDFMDGTVLGSFQTY